MLARILYIILVAQNWKTMYHTLYIHPSVSTVLPFSSGTVKVIIIIHILAPRI